jgi:membrane associated rhomboid family serine protease
VRRILIALAAIHVATFALYLLSDANYARFTDPLHLDGARWFSNLPLVPLWELATYGLLHSPVDLMHLLGNLLTLYMFGTMLEEELGSRRFAITYVASQVVGALVFLAAGWAGMPSGPAIGASGACFGVMMATAALFPDRQILFIVVPLKMRWLATIIVALTVFSALLQLKHGTSGTAHLIHLGGLVYGYVAVRTGFIRKDPVEALEHHRAVKEVERAQSDEARLDELLAKISKDGIGSLSKSEREFLKKASTRK